MKYTLLLFISISSALAYETCEDKYEHQPDKHIFFANMVESKTLELKALPRPITGQPKTKLKLKMVGFDECQGGALVQKDILKASIKFEKTLASTSFRNLIYNHRYKKKKQFKKNNGISNAAIYKKIQYGADKYNQKIDYEIDMTLCPYYSSKNVFGYTYSNRKEVWVNFKYYRDKYNNFSLADIVGNLMHEWIHNAGFGHSSKPNRTRKYTVPYAVGYIAREVAKKVTL